MKPEFKWSEYIPERMQSGKAYTPGEQRNTEDWIKINTNEFPYDPSPRVGEAIQAATGKLRYYPDPTGRALREVIAEQNSVSPEQVVLFNGCDDALNCCIRGLLNPGDKAAYLNPSYSLYTTLLSNHGVTGVPVEFSEGFRLPVDVLVGCDAKLFLLTSPNAPSGVAFDRADFIALLERKEAIFVVDETYGDFAKWSAIPLIETYPNLIVVKSFSKTFGLAGLRLGFGIMSLEVVDTFHKIRDVYNVDRLGQAAGVAALSDRDYYKEKHRQIFETREQFLKFVESELGWRVYDSSTNFVFMFPRNSRGEEGSEVAQQLYAFLVENHILVRYFSNHSLIEAGLRVSIGTSEQMDKVRNQIKRWADQRIASIERNTNETQISLELGIDGEGTFEGSLWSGFCGPHADVIL